MPPATMSPPAEAGVDTDIKMEDAPDTKSALTPPTSEGTNKKEEDSDSELSDLEPEQVEEPDVAKAKPEQKIEEKVEEKMEDVVEEEVEYDGEIFPDHYYEDGNIPVFKPTMNQFRSFKNFIHKIDKYGMKSGIVKVIPPPEWRKNLPSLEEQVKSIRVKNPITQEFHGTHGTYTQANIEKQRSYNLPQWKSLCEESNHQPPAKRGERRRNQEKVVRGATARAKTAATPTEPKEPKVKEKKEPKEKEKKKPGRPGRGRPRKYPLPTTEKVEEGDETENAGVQVPPTPTSPAMKPTKGKRGPKPKKERASDDEGSKPRGRQPKSVSSRRQHNKQDKPDIIDEEAFKDFDYRVYDQDEWTTERCQELETAYWKSLTFNNPMYGADMPGSLFDDSTKSWNVAKLENLLDVLGQKVPGVNTAYLYLGMWKASFAWHLEDVDLYSINYIHFGAPKQWYSISQADARRFESAMRNVWPSDAKNCDQFLRHKTYLISPQLLQSQYNIKVNRLVHHEGEFVITFPYGYHSGYNLGYNCAESVNFATEAWLDYGRIAKKCNCEADSVWVDVRDIERKLRGEPTPEYYEETDDDEEEEEEEASTLPTPPGSVKGKPKRSHKRKRDANEKDGKPKVKKLRIRIKAPSYQPCVLCPNDNKHEKLLPTDNGKMAHHICGLYTPETHISDESGSAKIYNVEDVDKARLELKCHHCKTKKGAKVQCSAPKCVRAYHPTCAAAAGVLVDMGPMPTFGADGTEYIKEDGIDYRCRFHRSKRAKALDSAALEDNTFIRKQAVKIQSGEVVQAQFHLQEIFAGYVVENRKDEEFVLLETLPKGEIMQVEWKWLLILDPMKSMRAIPSADAKPMPPEMKWHNRTTAEAPKNVNDPKPNEPFCDANAIFKWSEFNSCKPFKNVDQVKIDIDKPEKLWYYLGRPSTEAKAQYTHDLAIQKHNTKAVYLETPGVRSTPLAIVPPVRRSFPASYPSGTTINQNAINAARANSQVSHPKLTPVVSKDRPYHGKYAITEPLPYQYKPTNKFSPDSFQPRSQQFEPWQQYDRPSQPQQYHHHHSFSISNLNNQTQPVHDVSGLSGQGQKPATDLYKSPDNFDYSYNFNRTAQQPFQSPTVQTPSTYARPQAPIANMMGGSGGPPVTPITITKPSAFLQRRESESNTGQTMHHQTPPHSAKFSSCAVSSPLLDSPTTPETKGVSHLNVPENLYYLHNAEKERPLVYQSPYAVGGGFTKPYLPAPDASPKARPRGPSMSEHFLSKQNHTYKEEVARKMSEDRARLQQENRERIHRRLSQSQAQRPIFPQYPHAQPSLSQTQLQHVSMSAIQDPDSHKPSQSSHNTNSYFHPNPTAATPSYSQYSPSYPGGTTYQQPPSYSHHHSHSHSSSYPNPNPTPHTGPSQPYYTPHHSHSYAKPASLQFSSPQDFQMQMERATAAQRPQSESYQKFYSGLNNAAAAGGGGNSGQGTFGGHGHQTHESPVSGGGGGGGGQGSPLKYEMGGGGETLPMMRDRSQF